MSLFWKQFLNGYVQQTADSLLCQHIWLTLTIDPGVYRRFVLASGSGDFLYHLAPLTLPWIRGKSFHVLTKYHLSNFFR